MGEETASHHEEKDQETSSGNVEARAQTQSRKPVHKLIAAAGRRLSGPISAGHIFMLANTLAVVTLAALVFWMVVRRVDSSSGKEPVASTRPAHVATQRADSSGPDSEGPQEIQAVSWKTAQAAFAKKDYAGALEQYSLLWKLLHGRAAKDFTSGFFQLRIGQCHQRLGKGAQAGPPLIQAAADISPAVRAGANYELARLAEAEGQYLQARMRAYLAVANAAPLPEADALARECDFLVARALTKKVLLFHRADDPTPWSVRPQLGLFMGLDEQTLGRALEAGIQSAAAAAISPRVHRLEGQGLVERFSAACWRAPLEDLLGCIVTKAGIELRWAEVPGPVRQRQISLDSPAAPALRLCEVAAGSAGLVARFTGKGVILHDPVAYESMTHCREILQGEAISAWRRLFLRNPQGECAAEGHFAIALLQECSGEIVEAINEYRLIARRFRRSRVAPLALLRNASLLIQLRDYTGARAELTSLLNRYPDCEQSAQAYAALAEATMQAGQSAEAFGLFKKLYFLNLSASSRRLACFRAAKCLYQQRHYREAITWLDRYIILPAKPGQEDMAEAYLLRGQACAAVGVGPQAIQAFRLAIAGRLAPNRKTDALLGLARAYWKTGEVAKAMAALKMAGGGNRTPEQEYRVLSLTAELYRGIGLPEMGAKFLRVELDSISDPHMRAVLRVELARCYRQAQRMSAAYEELTEALPALPAGRRSQEAACDLAEVSLATGRPKQAITVAGQVVGSSADAAQRQRAQKILVAAYLARGRYDTAAMALAAATKAKAGGKEK